LLVLADNFPQRHLDRSPDFRIHLDKELPEADLVLLEHLGDSQDFAVSGNIASLIHRYATPAVEPQVAGYLDERAGKLACMIQEPLLAYLLKHDPVNARSRVEAAMAARGKGFSACNHSLLPEVGKLQNDPLLEEVATRGLDDSDPEVVAGAAAYLTEHGSPKAEEVLWAHFIAWSQRWHGRETELRYVAGKEDMRGVYEAGAGSNMMQALATGQGWLADEAKLRRLIELSVGEQQRQQAEQYLEAWQTRPWAIQFIGFGQGEFRIAQYGSKSLQGAKDKLRQFPKGSKFQWSVAGGQDSEENAFQELSKFALGLGMEIARNPR
jgi:hypothetical protein